MKANRKTRPRQKIEDRNEMKLYERPGMAKIFTTQPLINNKYKFIGNAMTFKHSQPKMGGHISGLRI
jgi:hypothetical protein